MPFVLKSFILTKLDHSEINEKTPKHGILVLEEDFCAGMFPSLLLRFPNLCLLFQIVFSLKQPLFPIFYLQENFFFHLSKNFKFMNITEKCKKMAKFLTAHL